LEKNKEYYEKLAKELKTCPKCNSWDIRVLYEEMSEVYLIKCFHCLSKLEEKPYIIEKLIKLFKYEREVQSSFEIHNWTLGKYKEFLKKLENIHLEIDILPEELSELRDDEL